MQTSDQAEQIRKAPPSDIRTMRRARQWKLQHPVMVPGDDSAELTRWDGIGRRVLVVGKPATGSQVHMANPRAARLFTDGHYPLVTCEGGTQVSYAGHWFGDDTYTCAQAASMWARLEQLLQAEWRDDGVSLLMTPATTGRDLWARTIPAGGWPVMSPSTQVIVRASSGQGRMETFRHRESPARLRQVYEYDARMCYVALMHSLPVGEPELLTGAEAAGWYQAHPYAEARYQVTWQAPAGWDRPGILPAHAEGTERDWCWPMRSDRPSWCSGAELFVAERHGWQVQHHGALVWHAQAGVLDTWRERLLRVLAVTQRYPEPFAGMMRTALRGLLLHTLGSFHGAPHPVTATGSLDDVPEDAQGVRALPDGRFTWRTVQAPKWAEMVHPEWSATVWGRARARLLYGHRGATGVLTIDPRHIVAMRTDAVYTSEPTHWDWLDDGKAGRYRLRTYSWGAKQPRPTNGPQLLQLRALAGAQ